MLATLSVTALDGAVGAAGTMLTAYSLGAAGDGISRDLDKRGYDNAFRMPDKPL